MPPHLIASLQPWQIITAAITAIFAFRFIGHQVQVYDPYHNFYHTDQLNFERFTRAYQATLYVKTSTDYNWYAPNVTVYVQHPTKASPILTSRPKNTTVIIEDFDTNLGVLSSLNANMRWVVEDEPMRTERAARLANAKARFNARRAHVESQATSQGFDSAQMEKIKSCLRWIGKLMGALLALIDVARPFAIVAWVERLARPHFPPPDRVNQPHHVVVPTTPLLSYIDWTIHRELKQIFTDFTEKSVVRSTRREWAYRLVIRLFRSLLAKARNQIDGLNQRLEQSANTVADLNTNLVRTRATVGDQVRELENLRTSYRTELESHQKEMDNTNDEAQSRINVAVRKLNEARKERDDFKAVVTPKLEAAQALARSRQETIIKHDSTISYLQGQHRHDIIQLTTLREQNASSTDREAHLQKQNSELQEQIQSSEATAATQMTELSEQVEELQAELTAKEKKLSAQAAQLDDYEAKLDKYLNERSSKDQGDDKDGDAGNGGDKRQGDDDNGDAGNGGNNQQGDDDNGDAGNGGNNQQGDDDNGDAGNKTDTSRATSGGITSTSLPRPPAFNNIQDAARARFLSRQERISKQGRPKPSPTQATSSQSPNQAAPDPLDVAPCQYCAVRNHGPKRESRSRHPERKCRWSPHGINAEKKAEDRPGVADRPLLGDKPFQTARPSW